MRSSRSWFALRNMIWAARVESIVVEVLSMTCPNPLPTRSEGAEEGRRGRRRGGRRRRQRRRGRLLHIFRVVRSVTNQLSPIPRLFHGIKAFIPCAQLSRGIIFGLSRYSPYLEPSNLRPARSFYSPVKIFYSLLSLPSYQSSALRNLFLWLLPDCFVRRFEPRWASLASLSLLTMLVD